MDSRTRERVEGWQAVPCDAGLDGLRDLADDEFSGVVSGAGAWAFVLNGRIVGLSDGTLDDFEGVPLTAYGAPDPALPLLFAMQEEGGETQAQYYTNDTPIAEARETLSDGSFTGYVELSENVLSGDYYVCFYGGRALPVAFIGSSERLLTGDEAFERANDEVGIYEVKAVDIDVVELPDPDDESVAGGAVADADDEGPAATGAEESTPGDESAPIGAEDEPASPADGPTTEGEETDVTASTPDETEGGDGGTPAPTATDEASDSGTAPDDRQESDAATATEESPDETADETTSRRTSEDSSRSKETTPDRETEDAEPTPSAPSDRTPEREPQSRDRSGPQSRDATDSDRSGRTAREPSPGSAESDEGDASRGDDPRFEGEVEWRKTKRIPSIDPDRSSDADETSAAPPDAGRARSLPDSSSDPRSKRRRESGASGSSTDSDRRSSSSSEPTQTRETHPDRDETGTKAEPSRRATDRSSTPAGSGRDVEGTPSDDSLEKPFEQAMLEREDEIDRLQQRVSDLETERDTLQAERDTLEREKDSVEDENERLRDRVEELEGEVEALEAQIDELEATLERSDAAGSGTTREPTRSMSAEQALAATNLFLRYDSKGQATLEDVHAGDADADALNANLRLEHHTNFDATEVAVDGTPYEQFLEESIHFEFVAWLLRDLPFEIRETGNSNAMDGLYDAIPKIDRVECKGTVEIEADDEDGGIVREFDLVARDRMGHPLIIANLNDSLDAATEDMMVSLQESATAVKEAHDELGAAFLVTTSFFDPGALEVAAEATSGSLLSRDSRKSFVKLSRKRGYHLGLVETRDGNFHVNVPEL